MTEIDRWSSPAVLVTRNCSLAYAERHRRFIPYYVATPTAVCRLPGGVPACSASCAALFWLGTRRRAEASIPDRRWFTEVARRCLSSPHHRTGSDQFASAEIACAVCAACLRPARTQRHAGNMPQALGVLRRRYDI